MTNKSKRRIKSSAERRAQGELSESRKIDKHLKELGKMGKLINPPPSMPYKVPPKSYTHHHNDTCKHPEVRLVGTRQGIVEVCVHCAATWKQEDEHTY